MAYEEINLGNISLNPVGEYDSEAEYEYLDLVSYEGGSYACTAELGEKIKGIAPAQGENSESWQLITLPGDATQKYKDMYDSVRRWNENVNTKATEIEESVRYNGEKEVSIIAAVKENGKIKEEVEEYKKAAGGYADLAEKSSEQAQKAKDDVLQRIKGFNDTFDSNTSNAISSINKVVADATTQAENAIQNASDKEKKDIQEVSSQEIAKVNDAVKEAETVKKTLEEATTDAGTSEEGRVAAEKERVVAEAKRAEAEEKRSDAEEGRVAAEKSREALAETLESRIRAIEALGLYRNENGHICQRREK